MLDEAELIITQEPGKVHKEFSSETVPVVWKVLPAIEGFIQTWSEMASDDEYSMLKPAILHGLETAEKYFGMASRSSAQIMSLCTFNAIII